MRVTRHLIRLTAAIGCLLLTGLFNAGAAIEKSPKFETDGLFLQSLPASEIASPIGEDDSTTGTTTYAYDAAHNRIEKTQGTLRTVYSYNAVNQLLSLAEGPRLVTYAYDANGNRLTRSEGNRTDTFRWDVENRLVSLTKQSLSGGGNYLWDYDYRTRRVGYTRPGMGRPSRENLNLTNIGRIRVVFSGGTSVREIEDGTVAVDYVRGSDWGGGVGGILYTLRNGLPSFTHYNGRGDVVAKTNGNGTLTYQASYEGFGLRQAEWGSTPDRQKSNTKDEDIPGYANEGHRFRDVETGTFLSKDPLGFVDGPNLYAYVQQNPWTKFDPHGLYADLAIEVVSIGVGITSAVSNFRSGNVGEGFADLGFVAVDGVLAAVPLAPGGTGLLRQGAKQAAKHGDTLVDAMKGGDKAGDVASNAAGASKAGDAAPAGNPQKVPAGGDSPSGPTAKDVSEGGGSSGGGSGGDGGGGSGGGDKDFDQARREAFEQAGMTDPSKVEFTHIDPETGTVVGFKGEGGAKVVYDGPHPDVPGPSHDVPHVGYQTPGKVQDGGRQRGNIPYEGPQHPSRTPESKVDPH